MVAARPVGEPFTASTLNDPLERREAHETTSDLLPCALGVAG
jgi:hypothetical protein